MLSRLLLWGHWTLGLLLLWTCSVEDVFSHSNPHSTLIKKLLRGYEAYPPPNGPTTVALGIYINYFYAMSEQSMDYQLSFYMRQEWNDSRFEFDPKENSNIMKLKLDDSIIKRLWIPDVFFRNEKGADFHKVTQNNRLLYIHHDGRFWYVSKISATFSCPMNLRKYPMDTQQCPIWFESFGYSKDTIVYQWLGSSVEFDPQGRTLPEMVIDYFETSDCSFSAKSGYEPGEYPCLEVRFFATRRLGYFMIQFYIPSVLLVILSWVSFWISADAVVARVSIGLLTVLNLVTQSTGSRNQLPKVSYIKAIDVWMTVCLVFAFASLIEFAVVNVWSRTEARKKKMQAPKDTGGAAAAAAPGGGGGGGAGGAATATVATGNATGTTPSQAKKDDGMTQKQVNLQVSDQSGGGGPGGGGGRRTRRLSDISDIFRQPLQSIHQRRAQTLDQLSRFIFPCTFLLFNVVYWVVYSLAP